MFYILVILGTLSISLGAFLEKGYTGSIKKDILIEEIQNNTNEDNKVAEKIDAQLLEKRIDILEEILFKKTLEEEKTKKSISLEEEEVEQDSLEKHKLIKKYEKQHKSVDEIAKLLNMNKGEVLLLKSLYKNS